jgi:23S rRNA pseudouridine1911/1915/1917 synthase
MGCMTKITILFEDNDVLVINKPAGLAVHADVRTLTEASVASFILENYPKIKNVGEPMEVEVAGGPTSPDGLRRANKKINIPRPGIVHRLDKETSGVLIIAKNQKTFESLKEQFQNHTIKKVYRAFVYGFVSDPKASLATGKRGTIDAPIGRSPRDIRMWTAGRGAREPLREAVTEYTVLNRFSDVSQDDDTKPTLEHQFSYIEAYPKTGRTHQIRVHMRYINHPVVSDPLYRGAKEMALGMKRLALHAYSITFRLPNGMSHTVEAPPPADFKKVISTYLK